MIEDGKKKKKKKQGRCERFFNFTVPKAFTLSWAMGNCNGEVVGSHEQEEASASISCGGVASYKSVRSSIDDGMPEQELPITANGCYKEKEKTKN